jgi:hypothetical protein
MSAQGQTLQLVRGWAKREVSFGPKTDLIPKPNPVAHASRRTPKNFAVRRCGAVHLTLHVEITLRLIINFAIVTRHKLGENTL